MTERWRRPWHRRLCATFAQLQRQTFTSYISVNVVWSARPPALPVSTFYYRTSIFSFNTTRHMPNDDNASWYCTPVWCWSTSNTVHYHGQTHVLENTQQSNYTPSPVDRKTGYLFSIDFFVSFILCKQDYEKPAGPICMKLSGKVWSDHGTIWLHFWPIPRNRAMPRCATRGRGLLCFRTTTCSTSDLSGVWRQVTKRWTRNHRVPS